MTRDEIQATINRDSEVLREALRLGLSTRKIQAEYLPHRSVTWIAEARVRLGLFRPDNRPDHVVENESLSDQRQRFAASSEAFLSAMHAHHGIGCGELAIKAGVPRHVERTNHGSIITSMAALCSERG